MSSRTYKSRSAVGAVYTLLALFMSVCKHGYDVQLKSGNNHRLECVHLHNFSEGCELFKLVNILILLISNTKYRLGHTLHVTGSIVTTINLNKHTRNQCDHGKKGAISKTSEMNGIEREERPTIST